MKKIGVLLFILLTFQLVSAAEIELTKEVYHPGEVLQAEIIGAFPDGIILENLGLFREDQVHKTPTDSDITLDEGIYKYYATLPFIEGNFSLKLQNTKYFIGYETLEGDVVKEFKIEKTNESYLSIDKGFIITRNDFEVKVRGINGIQDVDAEFEATGETKEIRLITNQEKIIFFSIDGIENFTKSNLKINDYDIPVYVYPKENGGNGDDEPVEFFLDDYLIFSPSNLNITVLKNTDYSFNIELKNDANISFEDPFDVEVEDENGFTIDPVIINSIDDEETIDISLTINIDENIDTNLIIGNETDYVRLPIHAIVTEEEDKVDISLSQECAASGGTICTSGQTCDSQEVVLSQGIKCCLGSCIEEEGGGTGWVWGLLILLLLGIGGYYFYTKIKKGEMKSPKELLAQRTKNFKARTQGKEVTKGLSRS